LQQKLLAERDGILAWAVQGCMDWQRLGRLEPPQQVLDATDEYFEEEDAIGEFLDEDCSLSPVAREAISAIYLRWRERAERRGEYVGTSRWLTQQLINRGFARIRLSKGIKALSGLSLKPKETPGYMPYRDD
jgi:putative DNA primase/helicase